MGAGQEAQRPEPQPRLPDGNRRPSLHESAFVIWVSQTGQNLFGGAKTLSTLAPVIHVLAFSWTRGYPRRPSNSLNPIWAAWRASGGGHSEAWEGPQGFSAVLSSGGLLGAGSCGPPRSHFNRWQNKLLIKHEKASGSERYDFPVPLALILPFSLPRTRASCRHPGLPTRLSRTLRALSRGEGRGGACWCVGKGGSLQTDNWLQT